MKQLELELQERLLIVEAEKEKFIWELPLLKNIDYSIELICKGDELTEELAEGLVENYLKYMNTTPVYRNYSVTEKDLKKDNWAHCAETALESFISAIEAKEYYWGENPLEKPAKNDLNGSFFTMQTNFHKEKAYDEAESRTFNPSRTLIFKIS